MGKTIIITSGPTNERIDAVMKITNMSTGALGCRVAQKLLENPDVDKIYYISPKLAYKPDYPFDDGRLHLIQVESTDDLLNTLGVLLRNPGEHIDAVVHSAAVGDYKGRYAIRAEDLITEILKAQSDTQGLLTREQLTEIFVSPKSLQDDSTKISSYEPNLMVMLDLTPKVIGSIKQAAPNTMLIGFKLLEGITNQELFDVASRLRRKNDADYIIANDLARIGGGKHWAMIVGQDKADPEKDAVVCECQDKNEIADVIQNLIFGREAKS